MRPGGRFFSQRLWLMRAVCSNFRRGEQGGSLIESAVSLGIFIMVLMMIVAGSRIVFSDIFVGAVAHMATRYAIVRGSSFAGTACANPSSASCDATNSDITSYVQTVMPSGIANSGNLTVTTTWPGTTVTGVPCIVTNGANSPGCIVIVQITYGFNYSLPFIPGSTLNLASRSKVTILQ